MTASDSELMVALASGEREAALAELVRRHIDLVYSAALRQVGGDTHLAEDVVQIVFARLLAFATRIGPRESLVGWLYSTTHHVAANIVRSERRRKNREQEAQLMEDIHAEAETDWSTLRPVLDESMHELSGADREAILLRFFERLPVQVIGDRLGVSENAAAKRIERALDKLRARFARRGITSSVTALAVALETQSIQAAPVGLSTTLTATLLSGSATATGLGLGLTFMSTTKLTVSLVAAAAILGLGTGYATIERHQTQVALDAALRTASDLDARLTAAEAGLAAQTKRLQIAEEQNRKLLATAKAAPMEEPAEPKITSALVNERFRRAQQLAASGDFEAALREFLWCYNVGFPRTEGASPVRTTSLLLIGTLGDRYEPARAALRSIRDAALARARTETSDPEAVRVVAVSNQALHDEAANIALFDELPKGDKRRQVLALAGYDYLIQAQRYADAVEGQPFASVSSLFENLRTVPASVVTVPNAAEARREQLVTLTTKNIEAFLGVGDIDHARDLATRLLAFDPSDATRQLLEQHAARAGHPGFLTSSATP